MCKKSLLDKIGLFDENFIHGGYEDIDLFVRIKENGGRLLMTPKVQYWHKEGATRFSEEACGAGNSEKSRQATAETHNLAYFIKKHGYNPHQKFGTIFRSEQINF